MTDETADLTPPTPERDETPEPTAETSSDERTERFAKRQAELDAMSDEELKERFWTLSRQMMEPVVELARTHTSPSIERSILLRMGIDSVSSHGVVDAIHDKGLLGKGAGHVVLKLAHQRGCDVRAAAAAITEDASVLDGLFTSK